MLFFWFRCIFIYCIFSKLYALALTELYKTVTMLVQSLLIFLRLLCSPLGFFFGFCFRCIVFFIRTWLLKRNRSYQTIINGIHLAGTRRTWQMISENNMNYYCWRFLFVRYTSLIPCTFHISFDSTLWWWFAFDTLTCIQPSLCRACVYLSGCRTILFMCCKSNKLNTFREYVSSIW